VPGKGIVADLNMDMFLPLFPLKYLEVQGLGESTLGDDLRTVCEPTGVQLQADKQPDHNRFIRSDQYSSLSRRACRRWPSNSGGCRVRRRRRFLTIGRKSGITGRQTMRTNPWMR